MSAIAQSSPRTLRMKIRSRSRYRLPFTILLLLADVLGVECALWIALQLRYTLQPWMGARIGPSQYHALGFAVLVVPVAYYWVGLYSSYGTGAVQRLRNRIYTTTLIFSLLIAWNFAFNQEVWSRGILLGAMVFAFILPALFEFGVRSVLTAADLMGMHVLVLGAGAAGAGVIQKLRRDPSLGLIPIAALDDDPGKWGREISGVPVAGPLSHAPFYREDAECAIIAMPGIRNGALAQLVEDLHFSKVIVIPDLPGVQTLWTVSRDLGGVLGLELRKNLLLRRNRIVKRLLDYAIALPAFVLVLPVLAACALAIRLSSEGPIFYCQDREGAGGHKIKVWKLRTMYIDGDRILREYLANHPEQQEHWLRFFKLKDDPRVLPGIGKFLRATSLDELPQLWNVLKGEMSLVGPRPFPHYHLNSFGSAFRTLRRSVTPGVTGLWQVSERSDADLKLQETLDTYYIRNWSVWLDIYILLRTFRTVLFPTGAY